MMVPPGCGEATKLYYPLLLSLKMRQALSMCSRQRGTLAGFALCLLLATLLMLEQVARPAAGTWAGTWKALLADRRAALCTTTFGLHVVAGVYHLMRPL